MTRLQDQRMIVTGAASGIGKAAAGILKERGAIVIALDRRAPNDTVADEFIQFDQGDFASVDAALRKAPAQIDGLLNIAGAAPSAEHSPLDILAINFYGIRRLTDGLRARMTRGAAIVNMSSTAGRRWRENAETAKEFLAAPDLDAASDLANRHNISLNGLGDSSVYPLSKQLLNLWTVQSFPSLERDGLRMNAIASAAVDTPILDDFLQSFGADSAERIRSIGVASPESIADAAVFLASAQSAWIKGAIIAVDGGAAALAAIKALALRTD